MATEIAVDTGGLDGSDWDRLAVSLHAGASIMGGATGQAGTRSGILPGQNLPLQYFSAGGMVGTLRAGRYWLSAPDAANGGYLLVLPSNVNLTHATASASQPRTDLIIAEVSDVGTSASFKRFRIVQGQAVAGAPAPTTNWATPGGSGVDLGNGNWAIIATVPIAANATALGTIANRETYTVAPGGTLPLPGGMGLAAGARQALAAGLPLGQRWIDLAAVPLAEGIVRGGDLCPTNARELAAVSAYTGGGSDVTGTSPSTLVATSTLALVGGTRRLQITASFSAVTSSGTAQLRVFLGGAGASNAPGQDAKYVQVPASPAPARAGEVITWSVTAAGSVIYSLQCLVEGGGTVTVSQCFLQVLDLGPA